MILASGMCASTVLLMALVPAGGHLVTTTDCYRKTRIFIETILPKMGITVLIRLFGGLIAFCCVGNCFLFKEIAFLFLLFKVLFDSKVRLLPCDQIPVGDLCTRPPFMDMYNFLWL